jgi:tRNA(fMet)-specific endonuclease VapC
MHLLDSDTLSHLYSGHPRVIANLRAVDDPDIATTIVTKIEILRARYAYVLKAANGEQLLRAQQWLAVSEEQLSQMLIVGFNVVAGNHFDRLQRIRKLNRVGRADLLIASIALANQATLVTRNLRHFQQIPNLRLANWVDS